MTKSTWLRMVTVASTLALGSLAWAQSGGGTDPDRDTGSPKTHSKKTTKKTTRSTTTESTAMPDDTRAKTPNSQRDRDLENSPGGTDETTVPHSTTPPNH
jgi:hypothetical protein